MMNLELNELNFSHCFGGHKNHKKLSIFIFFLFRKNSCTELSAKHFFQKSKKKNPYCTFSPLIEVKIKFEIINMSHLYINVILQTNHFIAVTLQMNFKEIK
jgi:hypothetical protein